MDFTFRVTPIDAEHSGPIVASFLQGPPPTGVPLQAGAGAQAPLRWSFAGGGVGEGKRAGHRRLQCESASAVYSAQNFAGGEGSAGFLGAPGYRYAVGVVSRKRGLVDLYAADGGGLVFGLQADASRGLTALLGEAGAAAAQGGSGLEGMDARAKRDALVDSFGSQKKKKMESARKANIVDVNAVAAAQEVSGGAAANAAAAAAAAARAAEAAAEAEGGEGSAAAGGGSESLEDMRRKLLPPFDLAAASPSEAYPLSTLLTPAAAELLRPLAKAILKAAKGSSGEQQQEELPAPVEALLPASFTHNSRASLQRLLPLLAGGQLERPEASKRLQCLLYASHLIALFQCGKFLKARDSGRAPGSAAGAAGAAGAGEAASEASRALLLHPSLDDSLQLAALSLGRFYEARSRATNLPVAPTSSQSLSLSVTYQRTGQCEKRLLYHIAALALRGEGGSLALGGLAEDMRISPVLLSKAFRELGCVCVKDKGGAGGGVAGFTATLKVPLTFPLPPRGKK